MSAAIKVLHSSNEFSSAVPTGRPNLLVCFVALILLVSRFIIVFFIWRQFPLFNLLTETKKRGFFSLHL